jgi:hypothetical protein
MKKGHPKRMKQAGHVARMGYNRNTYTFSGGNLKTQGKSVTVLAKKTNRKGRGTAPVILSLGALWK